MSGEISGFRGPYDLAAAVGGILGPTTPAALAKVCELEKRVLEVPQVEFTTHHVLHGGVYYRTICIRKGVVLTGALIKIPTTLVVSGKATVLIGDGEEHLVEGYRVFAASAGRKQAFITHEDTYITMSFKTNAKTVEEAEAEFTDDHERLMSRRGVNEIVITGE